MSKEFREVRKELSGPEAAPYIGYARKLLGEMKESMAKGNLSQLSKSVKTKDGTIVTVESVFGQDKITVSVPIKKIKTVGAKKKFQIEPYLWVGLRHTGGGVDVNGLLNTSFSLVVFEPRVDSTDNSKGFVLEDLGLSVSPRVSPVMLTQNGLELFTKNAANGYSLVGYDPENSTADWDQVVILDPLNESGLGVTGTVLSGAYTIMVVVTGDECLAGDKRSEFEIEIRAGKGAGRVYSKETIEVEGVSSYSAMFYPYGDDTDNGSNDPCSKKGYKGDNAHGTNWMVGSYEVVSNQGISRHKNNLLTLNTIHRKRENYDFRGFNLAVAAPNKNDICPKCTSVTHRLYSAGGTARVVSNNTSVNEDNNCALFFSGAQSRLYTTASFDVKFTPFFTISRFPMDFTNSAGKTATATSSVEKTIYTAPVSGCLSLHDCFSGFLYFNSYLSGCDGWVAPPVGTIGVGTPANLGADMGWTVDDYVAHQIQNDFIDATGQLINTNYTTISKSEYDALFLLHPYGTWSDSKRSN